MGSYKIHVRKIRLPKHKGFSQHRLDNIGRWETEVVWTHGESFPDFDFIYQGYEDSWAPALSRGHEEVEKHYDALMEHAFDDDYRRT